MPVNTPCDAYRANLSRWRRVRDCREGGDAIKARGTEYLPMLDSHKTSAAALSQDPSLGPTTTNSKYEDYKKRAHFYNATGRTIEGLGGAVFQKAPTIEFEAGIQDQLEDVTLTGLSADLFGQRLIYEILTTGRAGVLVDMPPKSEGGPEQRPFWCMYKAEDILSWQTSRVAGRLLLTQVVLQECYDEQDPKDPFVTKQRDRWRVLELADGKYQQTLFHYDAEGKEYRPGETVIPDRRGVPLDFIPFQFIGPTSTTPDVEKPPLLDLADVNLSHYRNSADYEHGLHYTGIPIPWIAGATAPRNEDGSAVSQQAGPSVMIEVSENGKVGIMQADGAMLGALENALDRKQKMMATLGARLLEDQPSTQETASAVQTRHSGEQATLRTMAGTEERGLTTVMRWHGWWLGTELRPEDVKAKYETNKRFFSMKATPDEVRGLLEAWNDAAISFETLYVKLQEGGWSREGVTADDERKLLDVEREGRDARQAKKDAALAQRMLNPGLGPMPPVAE